MGFLYLEGIALWDLWDFLGILNLILGIFYGNF